MATRMVRHAFAASCVLAMLVSTPAQSDGIRNTTCLHTAGAFTCTTQWRHGTTSQYLPWRVDARETAASAERERKWLARCRPLATEDQLGISRYRYAAAGCEFGKVED
jgi:hypothetical protein